MAGDRICALRELGYGLTGLARHLGITQPAVGYAVKSVKVKGSNLLLALLFSK